MEDLFFNLRARRGNAMLDHLERCYASDGPHTRERLDALDVLEADLWAWSWLPLHKRLWYWMVSAW